MEIAVWLVALVAVASVVAGVAQRYGFSAPLALTAVGVIGSYVTYIPTFQLDPEVVLVGLLPPLLYAAAIRSSLIDFKRNIRPIAWLSIGLVVVTAVAVGFAVWWLLPVPLAVGLALGAVVAPPDAVAATSIARRVGMPRPIVTILEGESLVNDATALVCLNSAIVAISGSVTIWSVSREFALSAVGGVAVGVLVAVVVVPIRKRVGEPVLDTSLSLLIPWFAYVPAEKMHASGVLAVVTTGLILGHKGPVIQSAASRISERTNWTTLQFVLENVVFLLIGLQARGIIDALGDSDLSAMRIAVSAAVVLVVVILVRPLWVFPVAYASHLLPGADSASPKPPWQFPALASWAGMRGVVTLAAVFVIPAATEHREVLVFLALVVTYGTLLLQGTTLPWLMRSLRVSGPDYAEDALQQAVVYQQASAAGLRRLDEVADEAQSDVVHDLRTRSERRANALWERLGGTARTPSDEFATLRGQMLQAEREELLRIRDTAAVDHDVLARVLAALDLEESIIDRVAFDSSEREVDLVARQHPDGECEHLAGAPGNARPRTAGRCDACVAEGLSWVHLRMCLTCGNVGCCDSSAGKHASRHFGQTEHPVMRSVEPGEAWRWCYVDQRTG